MDFGGFSGLGAIGGALLGGLGGGSRPAGTTTTSTASSSTQDIPDWLKPYVTGNLQGGVNARDTLFGGVLPQFLSTVHGDYLTPGTNPYLDQTYQHAANVVRRNVDSRFEGAGRYGSGAHDEALAEPLAGLASSLYGGAYNSERGRQAAATLAAPSFLMSPYTSFAGLIPNVRSSTSSGTETTPYFTNPLGEAASGALLGGILGGKAGLPGLAGIFGGGGRDPFANAIPSNGMFAGGGAYDPELESLMAAYGGGAAGGAAFEAGAADLLPLIFA